MAKGMYFSQGAKNLAASRIQRAFRSRRRGRVTTLGTAALARRVRLLEIEKENKHYGLSANWVGQGTTVTYVLLNGMGQGDGSSEREGLQIFMKSLSLRLFFHSNASAVVTAIRAIVVYDNQSNEAAPGLSDVIQSTTYPLTSFLRKQDITRFNVLMDKRILLDDTSTYTARCEINKVLNKKVFYSGTTSGVANIHKGAIYLMMVSDNNVNQPQFQYSTRLNYHDN